MSTNANTIRTTRRIALALLALLSSSCTPRTTPPSPHGAPIRTDSERYVLRPGQFGNQATIIATFSAPRDTAVHILHCNGAISWGLQQLVEDHWTDAWVAATNACLSPPIVVPAGGAHTDTLTIVPQGGAVLNPGEGDEGIVPGTYRVVWYHVLTSFDPNARPFGNELSLEQRVSDPIVIEPAP